MKTSMIAVVLTFTLSLALIMLSCTDTTDSPPTDFSPTDCYEVKAGYDLDAAIMWLCDTCPDVPPVGYCEAWYEIYAEGLEFLVACANMPMEPTASENMAWQCETVDENLGPDALTCGNEFVIDAFVNWRLFYCLQLFP